MVGLFFFFFTNVASADDIKIMTGLTAYDSIFKKVQNDFEKSSPHKLIFVGDMAKASADKTAAAIVAGQADIGVAPAVWEEWVSLMKSKGLKSEEVDTLVRRNIGKDKLKIVAHSSAGISKLGARELARVFSGEAKNWNEVGGENVPIKVHVLSTYPLVVGHFKKVILKDKDFATDSVREADFTKLRKLVVNQPGAVSFFPQHMDSEGLIEITGGPEQLGRPIVAITKGKPTAAIESLYRFLQDRDRN